MIRTFIITHFCWRLFICPFIGLISKFILLIGVIFSFFHKKLLVYLINFMNFVILFMNLVILLIDFVV
jgi:hypothetical protein